MNKIETSKTIKGNYEKNYEEIDSRKNYLIEKNRIIEKNKQETQIKYSEVNENKIIEENRDPFIHTHEEI